MALTQVQTAGLDELNKKIITAVHGGYKKGDTNVLRIS